MSFVERAEQLSLEQLTAALDNENSYSGGEYTLLRELQEQRRRSGDRSEGIATPTQVLCGKCEQWNDCTKRRCVWCEVALPQWSPKSWLLGEVDEVQFRSAPADDDDELLALGAIEDESLYQCDAQLMHLWQRPQRNRNDVQDNIAQLRLLDGREVTGYCETELYELLQVGELALATMQQLDREGKHWLLLDFGDRLVDELL